MKQNNVGSCPPHVVFPPPVLTSFFDHMSNEIIEAAVLGVVQGLTEFLPVSSSGHIEIARTIMGDTAVPEESALLTVVLHFATALSTIVVFRKEVGEILKGLFQFKYNEHAEFSLKIILSMIPAAIVGIVVR